MGPELRGRCARYLGAAEEGGSCHRRADSDQADSAGKGGAGERERRESGSL